MPDAAGSAVDAVIFDWGGTLTPWHAVDLEEQWRVYARRLGDPTLADRILAAESKAWARVRAEGTSSRIAEVLAEAGVGSDHPDHPAAQAAYEEFWEPHTFTDPDVPALFTGLKRRGIRIGVLSNTIWSREYHERVFARDGVLDLIDGAVYTSEIAHAKPHAEAFREAMAAVGATAPGRCVYVGDRPFEDISGAQRTGMRAILVPHSDIPVGQQVPVEVSPDGVANRLLDLLDILDGWSAGERGA